MDTITYENLHIKGPFAVDTIYGFSYHSSCGEHVIAEITGVVHRENFLQGWKEESEKYIKVYAEGEQQEISVIFYGLIQKAELSEEGGMCLISITAASSTCLMDRNKVSRSFQNINDTYADVMKQIVKSYKGAGLLWHGTDRKIERPFIQYQETDWQFIKRIASHLGVSVTAECRTKGPVFHVGYIKEQRAEKKAPEKYTVCFNPSYYKRTREQDYSDRKRYVVYKVQDRTDYRLGDCLCVAGKSMTICSKDAELKNGIVEFTYLLSNETFVERETEYNENIHGAVFYGSVLETTKEKVKICLEIDGRQDRETAYAFDWRPITGNLLYCMPEKGERIALYIQDSDEKNAVAAYGMRRNEMNCAEMDHPDNRSFTTAENKRLYMHPGTSGIEVIKGYSKQGYFKPMEMKLEDTSGVSVKADKAISIMAEKQVTLKGKNVLIKTPKEASLVRKDLLSPTVINLCNAFDAIGVSGNFASNLTEIVPDKGLPALKQENRQEQEEGQTFALPEQVREKTYDLGEAILPILSSIPMEQGMDELETKITGSMPLL